MFLFCFFAIIEEELVIRQDKQWNDISKLREVINKLSKSQGLAPIEAPKRIPASLDFKDDSKEISVSSSVTTIKISTLSNNP